MNFFFFFFFFFCCCCCLSVVKIQISFPSDVEARKIFSPLRGLLSASKSEHWVLSLIVTAIAAIIVQINDARDCARAQTRRKRAAVVQRNKLTLWSALFSTELGINTVL